VAAFAGISLGDIAIADNTVERFGAGEKIIRSCDDATTSPITLSLVLMPNSRIFRV